MPYKKVGPDKWVSPRGNTINDAQHRLWEAQGGKWPGEKTSERTMKSYAKGGDIRTIGYAAGGPVLGRTRNFMKEHDEFRDPDHIDPNFDEDNTYGKEGEGKGTGYAGGSLAKRSGDKSLKAVKPKK